MTNVIVCIILIVAMVSAFAFVMMSLFKVGVMADKTEQEERKVKSNEKEKED